MIISLPNISPWTVRLAVLSSLKQAFETVYKPRANYIILEIYGSLVLISAVLFPYI